MKAIFFKEIKEFFTSPIGYIAMGIFFLFNSLFLWIIDGNFNIPNSQFADLTPFFNLAPWILIFVMAAISMRMFSEEFKSGTIESLLTKPLLSFEIVLGKFFAVWSIGIMMVVPTLIYVVSIQALSVDGNLDWGSITTAYVGLLILMSAFAAIGIFASILFNNQVNAFLVGLFLMFLFYYGFEGLGNFNLLGNLDLFVQKLSLNMHYQNLLKGLISLADITYLLSISILFIFLTHNVLQNKIK